MPSPSRQLMIAAGVVAIAVVLAASQVVQQAWTRQARLLRPWQRALAATGLAAAGGDAVTVQHELIHLRADVEMLRSRLAEYDSIRGEGGLDPREALVGRARILARSTRGGRRYSQIDLGALDGVEKGMAVIVGWSLVGTVAGVDAGGGRALVQQLTDAQSRVPAVLMQGEHIVADGVIAGTGKRGELSLDFVEDRQGLAVTPGQTVVSAALPPSIPRGLVIGVVSAAQRSPSTDHWRIDVSPLHILETRDTVGLLRPAVSPR